MFKKLLSAVGIGGATVDTQLVTPVLQPGERFRVDVHVEGGEVRQAIDGLQLAVVTRVEIEAGDHEFVGAHVVQHWTVADGFVLEPGERQTIPFEAVLHPETPVTEIDCRSNQTRVWLQTGLAIDMAKDASDRDPVRVAPTPAMRAFLSAMRTCGFALQTADVEKGFLNAKTFRSHSGCYQEFEFRPMSLGHGLVQQVEVSFVPEEQRTHVLLEIDRAFRGDSFRAFTIDHRQIDEASLTSRIREAVGRR
ncbi:sporulation protein [Cognatilysobacter bugurensis]|uniref:SpoOM protein n=1 Tax=Cognatilysobacter bugurensis TaxID=543356 RepID=A0A918W8L4_9GAMM|nr:sporulation protein [Lysobacter bugurensis]GHA81529.1 SpoOM protein [Lysobacter bugurensis]